MARAHLDFVFVGKGRHGTLAVVTVVGGVVHVRARAVLGAQTRGRARGPAVTASDLRTVLAGSAGKRTDRGRRRTGVALHVVAHLSLVLVRLQAREEEHIKDELGVLREN